MLRHLSTRFLTYTCLRRAAKIESNLKLKLHPSVSNYGQLLHVRHKYVTSGVQGRRNSKTAPTKHTEEDEDDLHEIDTEERVALKNRYE